MTVEAFKEMAKLNREGYAFIVNTLNDKEVYGPDPEIKPYLIELLRSSDDLVRAQAACQLLDYEEEQLARETAIEIKNKKLAIKKMYDRNWKIMDWVQKILEETKGGNRK
ncbi:MAG: hypothetical protein QME81_15815 [bacterium]|nr:hypothetical protein [bacterium]